MRVFFFFRGFQSSTTAQLMLKRTRRQNKLATQAARRKKLAGYDTGHCKLARTVCPPHTYAHTLIPTIVNSDPNERLAIFKKNVTHPIAKALRQDDRRGYSSGGENP